MNKYIYVLGITFLMLLMPSITYAQDTDSKPSATDGIEYGIEMQSSTAFGDGTTPLWLNANKYGLSSLERNNGYFRTSLQRPLTLDKDFKWGLAYGLDVAATYNYTSNVVVQQAYIEGRWMKGTLTVGSKHQPMELKNQELSSGSQTLGINARPVPQIRIALPDYWTIPGTKGWLGLKGHIAYGMTTDDGWQKDFVADNMRYTQGALYHSKAGYIKIGNQYTPSPLSLELGLEMAALFGGRSYNINGNEIIKNQGGLKGMWDAFIPGGAETIEDVYRNVGGDQLGSWVARLNLDYDTWYGAIYGEHFFEDHSAMFFLDYDGYGTGNEWATKKDNKYLLYNFKDMMLGAEFRLKEATWLNSFVVEYLYTKYQSGSVYHDHTPSMPDHIGGKDDYYNHHIFTGWQHWGQVIGNPLYLSPIYNTDGEIRTKNNRFVAYHLGIAGDPNKKLHYRILATYQKGFGTYNKPYPNPRKVVSLMAEACYKFDRNSPLNGWSITASAGMDAGKLRGTNQGIQITINKTFRNNIVNNTLHINQGAKGMPQH